MAVLRLFYRISYREGEKMIERTLRNCSRGIAMLAWQGRRVITAYSLARVARVSPKTARKFLNDERTLRVLRNDYWSVRPNGAAVRYYVITSNLHEIELWLRGYGIEVAHQMEMEF